MFYQIKSDGQCETLRPGQLTSTNGCTRLPVQGDTQPSQSPSQTDSACGEAEKHLRSAHSQPQVCWSRSSIRNAIFPPAGLKLSLGVANIPVLGYLWVVCGGVWHYSSFRYRILDCPTDSDFLVPHSKTASNQSKGRLLVISLLPDKKRLKSHKVRSIETVQNLQMMWFFFFSINFELFSVLSAVTQFSNCEINFQAHSAWRNTRFTWLKVPYMSLVFNQFSAVTADKLQLVLEVNILCQSIKKYFSCKHSMSTH